MVIVGGRFYKYLSFRSAKESVGNFFTALVNERVYDTNLLFSNSLATELKTCCRLTEDICSFIVKTGIKKKLVLFFIPHIKRDL